MGIDMVMVERARREPTLEEIVVALRQTTRDAEPVHHFAITGPSRGKRIVSGINQSIDVVDLRDDEVERLLHENTRLNARVVSLLKVLEHMQSPHAESAVDQTAETTQTEADRDAIPRAVRMALEAELSPILLMLLRLLERQRANPGAGYREATRYAESAPATYPRPSSWLVNLMQGVEDKARTPNDKVAAADPMPRRSKLREFMAQVLNGFRLKPDAVESQCRHSPHKDPT
jgi:hypothetical protein